MGLYILLLSTHAPSLETVKTQLGRPSIVRQRFPLVEDGRKVFFGLSMAVCGQAEFQSFGQGMNLPKH